MTPDPKPNGDRPTARTAEPHRRIDVVVFFAAAATALIASISFCAVGASSAGERLSFVLVACAITGASATGAGALARAVRREVGSLSQALRPLDTDEPHSEPLAPSTVTPSAEHAPTLVAALVMARRKLELRFAEAHAADERARASRKNAERARGLLFAGVSHDLKSPLNALLGFADLMTLEPLTDGQKESLDLISSRGRELVALVETILDSARVEAGQLKLSPRPTDIGPILQDARLKAGELVHARKDVEVIVDPDAPAIAGDAAHLTRAFALVIAHALKSSAQGERAVEGHEVEAGGHFEGATRKPTAGDTVVVRAREVGAELRVDVEHHASGPSVAALEEVYFTKKRGKGLRLGLRLARTILELHGGRIEVLDKTNGRPTVACFVPLAARNAADDEGGSRQPKSVP